MAYLDPPYNQHSFLRNYHIWETLVRWDEPEVYGVACKRIDCKERGSDYNSKRRIKTALAGLLDASCRPRCCSCHSTTRATSATTTCRRSCSLSTER